MFNLIIDAQCSFHLTLHEAQTIRCSEIPQPCCSIQASAQNCVVHRTHRQAHNLELQRMSWPCILPSLYLLFVPVEILEVLVVMEGHVADGMALALLVGGIHNRVGGVREVDEVATIFKRLYNLTIYKVDSQL